MDTLHKAAPPGYDPLDMRQYRIEKLPKRDKGKVEKWLAILGPPLALISFLLFALVIKLPFLADIDPESLTVRRL